MRLLPGTETEIDYQYLLFGEHEYYQSAHLSLDGWKHES